MFGQAMDSPQIFFGLEGLPQEIIRADTQRVITITGRSFSGYEHEWRFGEPGIPAQGLTQLIAAHLRHHGIKYDDVRLISSDAFNGNDAVRGGEGFKILV